MKYEEIEKNVLAASRRGERRRARELKEAARAAADDGTTKRMYASARHSRLTNDWTTATTSADAEIRTSLTALRARSRALSRDSAYAKRAKHIVVNNVIGGGIGLQAQVRSSRKRFMPRVNDAVEEAFKEWWTNPEICHTGGTLAAGMFERVLMDEVFDAGEVFVREHFTPFGGSDIPYALELIESERVPHSIQPNAISSGNEVRMGVEVDKYYRPTGYWIRDHHPSDFHYPGGARSPEQVTLVPANQIIHLRIVERWPQTRGVPWLHAVAKKLNDMDGYSEAEIVAARGAANYMATIELDPLANIGEEQEDGTRQIEVAPGIVVRLSAGEKLNFHSPNRPNTALDGFMRYMLRETAAGAMVSYESLSRDYSQSNYSSSRLALLDDRDTWRVLQIWFLQGFRQRLHRNWLQQAVLARRIAGVPVAEYATNRKKYEAVKYKPRGWSWVDPTKEVAAFKEAEKAGYITKTKIISETGGGHQDFEDVMDERRQELDSIAEKGLKFDTDSPAEKPAAAAPAEPAEPADDDDEDNVDDDDEQDDTDRQMRLVK